MTDFIAIYTLMEAGLRVFENLDVLYMYSKHRLKTHGCFWQENTLYICVLNKFA